MKTGNYEHNYLHPGFERIAKTLRVIFCFLVLSGCFEICVAQTVSVKASIDRDKILIGEPIHLELEATMPLGIDAKWMAPDSIPHFEFIEHAKIDTVRAAETKSFKQVLTITSFDSGRWHIPSLALEVDGKSYLTDSLPVSVAFSNFDPEQEYHDIKDIADVENPYTGDINWALGALTLLSLAALIYFLRKRKQVISRPVSKSESKLSPLEEALRSLEELKKQQLPEQGHVKQYYTRLNDILRWFLWRRMTMPTMEKTNEELILQVRSLGLPNDTFIRLAQGLRMSDAVKFAKFIPENDDNEQSFQTVRTSVELLNNLPK